jgi:serine protease Do
MISQNPPGSKVTLTVIRDGKTREFAAKLAALPGDEAGAAVGSSSVGKNSEHDGLDGVEVDDLTSAVRRENSIPTEVRGVLVSKVDPGSNAYEAGLRAGNVIQEIDRKPVKTAEEAVKACEDANGERVLVRVWSSEGGSGGSRFLSVDNTKKK